MKVGDKVINRYGIKGIITKEYTNYWDTVHPDNYLSMSPQDWLDAQQIPFTEDEINNQKWYSVNCNPGSIQSCEGQLVKEPNQEELKETI